MAQDKFLPNGAPSYERAQVVDDQKKFTPDLTKQITKWGLGDAGFNYNLVAVFGSQSTGKSTLLNRLFGTDFDVMDDAQRQQTTKGIWMCRAKSTNALVMDVEGTDGRERGEDQDFERKSALFSLASSEVLIVNMWENQVGWYQGANMGLLKTVFEVNLALFGKPAADGSHQKTLLLFVIRDHLGNTPMENLVKTLSSDMEGVWRSISKPAELKDRQLRDYFDLSFTTLSHKLLRPDVFEADVNRLRGRFVDRTRDDYVFKPTYHKRIPADGVAFYMESIWEKVQSNKDLDLPTQQELLAQFRCDEISAQALSEFNEQWKSQRKPVESGRVVNDLGNMMRGWWTNALSRYDQNASRYHKGVYQRKRTDLINVMESTLSPLFLGQLKNLHKSCLVSFKREMLEGMRGDNYSFADIVSDARSKFEELFLAGARDLLLDGVNWGYEEEYSLFQEEIQSVADQCRKDETKKMVNVIERNFKRSISEPVEIALMKPTSEMWDNVLTAFRKMLTKAESSYLTKAKSFNCTDEENTHSLAILRRRAWLALRAKIDEQTGDAAIIGKLRTHFEEMFRYDEAGIPRVWRPDDDIDRAFKVARDKTLTLIPIYCKIKPVDTSLEYSLPSEPSDLSGETEEFDFDATLTIFSETKALDISNRFRRDADAYYVEAKRSTVAGIAQIPYWIYCVLVVLGWNEAMAILFNPLYFTMFIVGIISAYFVYTLNLAGPLMQVGKTVGNEVYRQGHERLREHFSEPPQPVRTQPVRIKEETLDQDYDSVPRNRTREMKIQ